MRADHPPYLLVRAYGHPSLGDRVKGRRGAIFGLDADSKSRTWKLHMGARLSVSSRTGVPPSFRP